MSQHDPEPLDEGLAPPEMRGGNRPEDYMPDELPPAFQGRWGTDQPLDDEPPGGNDPDAQ